MVNINIEVLSGTSILVHVTSTLPMSEAVVSVSKDLFLSGDMLSIGAACAVPGDVVIGGLEEGAWYLVSASGALVDGGIQVSSVIRVRPIAAEQEPSYHIDLQREDLETYVIGRTTAYRIRISAKNPKGMPSKIFMYRREPFESFGETERDVFLTVCKPGDLEYFPEDEPGDAEPRYYRRDDVDIVDESAEGVEEVWDSIVADVGRLTEEMERLRYLRLGGVYTVYSNYHDPICQEIEEDVT